MVLKQFVDGVDLGYQVIEPDFPEKLYRPHLSERREI